MSSALLSVMMELLMNLIAMIVLGLVIFTSNFKYENDSEWWKGFIGCLSIFIAWSIKGSIYPGFPLHILGAAALTMILGWRKAIICGSIGVITATLSTNAPLISGLAFDLVNYIMLPATSIHLGGKIVEKILPNHLFIQIFVLAFFGGAASMFISCLSSACLFVTAGAYSFEKVLDVFFMSTVMMSFIEGWVTGAIFSIISIWAPNIIEFRKIPETMEMLGKRTDGG